MILGFRAGTDPTIGVLADDFLGTRRAWSLLNDQAPIGRVFPTGAMFDATSTPAAVVARVARACEPVLAAGMWPFPSLKPDPVALLAGALDAHLTAVGRYLASLGVRTYFTIWHEPENDTLGVSPLNYPARAARFVAMFSRAYPLIKTAAGSAVRMGPVHMAYQWRPGSLTTSGTAAAAWRVGGNARDFTGLDAYTSTSTWLTSGQTLPVRADFQRWMTALTVAPGEILLAERGITGTYPTPGLAAAAAQTVTLRADYDYLTAIGAHGMIIWNSEGAPDSSVYLLTSPARAMFATIAADAARLVQ